MLALIKGIDNGGMIYLSDRGGCFGTHRNLTQTTVATAEELQTILPDVAPGGYYQGLINLSQKRIRNGNKAICQEESA
ncbi:MAG: hypothetical protein ACYC3H_03505 [Bellilinea sp.]